MPKFCRAIAFAGLLLLLLAPGGTPARAATNAPAESFLIWNTEKDELLPQSSVISLLQTRDGYLWLGTMRGLVRFDGIHTEVFFEADTIVSLLEDRRGGRSRRTNHVRDRRCLGRSLALFEGWPLDAVSERPGGKHLGREPGSE